ncbi:hypothetical protein NEOLEDRAFT_1074694 [Neolentinus lepideus HHB14362 ss-1]|uniref:INO80 complex subunit B-like conserved region domain-containing protein n=1 Tax=Neolentinus lepideus HHB14362 ss-1 TaxID=1314782 RepID=A0A165PDX7_9AGAM|nr:hypothetical protein NEOLEDRAFT_1074694 [Neolentinus lepideus HHB14362 ss-1]
MTARQAAHAGVVETTHVSLTDEPSSRKKRLTDAEIALRREETARKRKHLSEKKKEEEKAETINRLLRAKSSRTRGGRRRAAPPPAPVTVDDTPADSNANPTPDEEAGEDAEVEMDIKEDTAPPPTWYRWTSSTKSMGEEGKMVLTFAVPQNALPAVPLAGDVPRVSRETPTCDVTGCSSIRKYRLVRDFTKGACGMAHLKQLESVVMDITA